MTIDASDPQIWAGLECTVNRVGDRYFDQCARNGFRRRLDDLDRFAALGIRALRCPFLWETLAPHGPDRADWAFADRVLDRLSRLGLRPIAGLVHHGSGPPQTSLLDDGFAAGLAAYAGAFARRYPWVTDYTPVNEPLTTARFSGLYGLWYPHRRDDPAFVKALLVQVRATVLAMQAVRAVNPHARLVQTEDMGRTWSTPLLRDQADFENARRWLSFDLLCGRVGPDHPLYGYLTAHGLTEEDRAFFAENAAPPDVVGLNYYLTSDRVLDERLAHYPERYHGGNGRIRYADAEAVRVLPGGIAGHRALLAEAWARYGRPVAITEVHVGSTREEQLRWLREAWEAGRAARAEGVDVRAITVWSLLGAYDWNSLVTQENGFYESGVFDLRGTSVPRPTALAAMTRGLATGAGFAHPVLETPGWWRRPERLQFGAFQSGDDPPPASPVEGRPIAIVGASGTLGRAFARLCGIRGLCHVSLSRADLDIADPASVAAALERHRPWAVVNAAGYVRVDAAESDADRCYRENATGPAVLAQACQRAGVRLLTFSSDLVFGGELDRPYEEGDAPRPLSVYGRSKHRAERHVLDANPSALVVRTSAFFGPWDTHNFLHQALATLERGQPFPAAGDTTVSPTYVPDLVHACLDLLIDAESGLWHLANGGAVTWAGWARRAAERAGLDPGLVVARPLEAFGLAAARPRFSALGSSRARLLGPLDAALGRYLQERRDAVVRHDYAVVIDLAPKPSGLLSN
ncbi:MAG TPA: family 1 glycosylhydrolase [Planctomycetota bacterium]|nr:family 1 glycosylhydrolase [Planctomycetota bacterium]